MQSHIIFSFITKLIFVIFCTFFLPALFCTGCGRKKGEAFTQTLYVQDAGGRDLTDKSRETENDAEGGAQDSSKGTGAPANTAEPAPRQICVFVCGAVRNEGVYYISEGSRVIDAVNAAGGYREDADRVYVNQAEYVYDAERVSIPTAAEAEALRSKTGPGDAAPAQSAGRSGSGLININTASKNELMEIPGIGESKAERIISYREDHGRFGSVEEIRNVSGIGSGIYEGLKDHITVE